MERSLGSRVLLVAALSAVVACTPARAQDPDDLQRGVARISVMNGEVSVRRGDSGDWVAGVINAPLLSDDRIATGPNSRAEVQFDAANILRIGGNAEVRLTQLEAGRYQMEVGRGTVTFRVLRQSDANVEVDTPTVSIRPSRQGIYRITVNEGGETQVMARAGEVEVFTPRGSQWVNSGQMMMARGNPSDPEFQIVAALPMDEWDQWCDARDRILLQSVSANYVGPGIYGAEDLDNYGSWENVQPYGNVWRPTHVSQDWAPYQEGRWVWEDWYGWTWVSSDPWGWAPYHYGRWFNQPGYGWCWYPGLRTARHYWSPALVGFFGFGTGSFGVGFGYGHVGWVPLAPYEVFHPWWGRNYYGRSAFERNINIRHGNIMDTYRNARVRNGISGVQAGDFQGGRFNNIGRFSGNQVREAGLIRGQVPIAPSQANLHFSNRGVGNVPRGGGTGSGRIFRSQQPNPAQRIPFAQQQQAFSGGGRNSGGDRNFSGDRNFGGGRNIGGGQATPGVSTPGGGRGGQQFGTPRGGDNQGFNQGLAGRDLRAQQPDLNNRAQQQPGGNGGGWRRFGEPGTAQPNGGGRNDGNLRGYQAPNAGGATDPRSRFQNTRPPGASEAPANRGGGWQRFGEPGGGGGRTLQIQPRYNSPAQPRYNAPDAGRSVPNYGSQPRYSAPDNNRSMPNFRSQQPRYSAPPQTQRSVPNYGSQPRYSAPQRSMPQYSAPQRNSSPNFGGGAPGRNYRAPESRQAPSFSAPRGGGGFSSPAPRQSAPSFSAPRQSAPRQSAPSYSAPRGGGGGGGSSPRSSGGGGGGGNSPRGNGGGHGRR